MINAFLQLEDIAVSRVCLSSTRVSLLITRTVVLYTPEGPDPGPEFDLAFPHRTYSREQYGMYVLCSNESTVGIRTLAANVLRSLVYEREISAFKGRLCVRKGTPEEPMNRRVNIRMPNKGKTVASAHQYYDRAIEWLFACEWLFAYDWFLAYV